MNFFSILFHKVLKLKNEKVNETNPVLDWAKQDNIITVEESRITFYKRLQYGIYSNAFKPLLPVNSKDNDSRNNKKKDNQSSDLPINVQSNECNDFPVDLR
ncbi:uncharacterized protein VNE69_07121 [Vairimorpha necatrix]|uniref:Uncharacterized protein n=1 Tax=Vairimorpha necatrix TaxID=6039 RepID=A0AAX4JDH1_9MICR